MTTHERMRIAVQTHGFTEEEIVRRWLHGRPASEEEKIRDHVRRFLAGDRCVIGLATTIIDLIVDQTLATRH